MYLPGAAALSSSEVKEVAGFGLLPSDYDAPEMSVEVWPDNWEYVKMFDAIGSQWRSGFNGPTGLDYAGVRAVLGAKFEFGTETFGAMKLMETAALGAMHGND